MALRIRKDGRILCAALHEEERYDTYIDDETHYHLSQVAKVLVTDPEPFHSDHGQWWWKNTLDGQEATARTVAISGEGSHDERARALYRAENLRDIREENDRRRPRPKAG